MAGGDLLARAERPPRRGFAIGPTLIEPFVPTFLETPTCSRDMSGSRQRKLRCPGSSRTRRV
jgi:hypothetical protein